MPAGRDGDEASDIAGWGAARPGWLPEHHYRHYRYRYRGEGGWGEGG